MSPHASAVPRRPRGPARTAAVALLAVLVALLLASCGGGDRGAEEPAGSGSGTPAAERGAFPTRIAHAYGTTEVPAQPKRVVTLGWSDGDVALALGTTPVGVYDLGPEYPEGVGPWATDRISGAAPQKLSTADGLPYERIAALRPDLILSVQSGLEKAEYRRLAGIAPTVAFRAGRAPYLTPWPEQTAIIGQALGRPRQARALVDRTNRTVARIRRENPSLEGRSFTYASYLRTGEIGVYSPDDLRVREIAKLGMRTPRAVAGLASKGEFYSTVSTEQVNLLEADVLVALEGTEDQTGIGRLPAVRDGRYVPLGTVDAQAQGAPTVLSIPWALERVVPRLVRAVRRADAS